MENLPKRSFILPKGQKNFSKKLLEEPFSYKDNEYPRVSIIIPTFNCAPSIGGTLDSLLEQDYPNYEIILIDGGSTDHTLDIVKSYHHTAIRIYSFSGYFRYEMLNKGVTLATGVYLNVLFPGDFYISRETLKYMMGLALHHDLPALAFCGTLLRDGRSEVKILYHHLNVSLLKQGQQPTSLQSCWFKKEVFNEIGKFNTSFKLRGGYDFMCRFVLHGGFHTVSTHHVLTDYDLHTITRKMIVSHFVETAKIINHYFGWGPTMSWLIRQKDIKRYIKILLRNLRIALIGH